MGRGLPSGSDIIPKESGICTSAGVLSFILRFPLTWDWEDGFHRQGQGGRVRSDEPWAVVLGEMGSEGLSGLGVPSAGPVTMLLFLEPSDSPLHF